MMNVYMMNNEELAASIKAGETWLDVEDELKELCERAGLADEYKEADGDHVEDVINRAADILGVEIY